MGLGTWVLLGTWIFVTAEKGERLQELDVEGQLFKAAGKGERLQGLGGVRSEF